MANDIENDAANFLTFIQGLWLNHFLYIFILFLRFFYWLSLCSRHVEKLLKACRNLLFSRREIEPLYLDWEKKSKRVVPSLSLQVFQMNIFRDFWKKSYRKIHEAKRTPASCHQSSEAVCCFKMWLLRWVSKTSANIKQKSFATIVNG